MNRAIRVGVRAGLATVAIAAAGCGRPSTFTGTSASTLTASAQTTISLRDTVQQMSTSVKLTNDGVAPVHLEYGACTVHLLAFRDAARSGAAVWNSDYREPYHSSVKYGCTLQLILTDLQPGASMDFGFQAPLIELVGDSLPNGRYYLAADLRLSSDPRFIHIPAGSVDVALSHPRR